MTNNGIKRIIQKTISLPVARYVLAIFGLLIALYTTFVFLGFDPIIALNTLFFTSFRTSRGFWATITKFIPLLLLTYTFTIPLKIRLFNIGGLGQMQIGGIFAFILVFELKNVPPIFIITLAIMASILAGSLYAYIAAFLVNKKNINPIITTSMLTFISSFLVQYVTSLDKYGELMSGFPMTHMIPRSTNLGYWGPIPRWIITIPVVVVFYYVLFKFFVIGFKIEATGNNKNAAKAYGIEARKVVIVTFLISGALAGLAGSFEVLGVHQRLITGFGNTSGSDFGTLGALTSLVAGVGSIGLPLSAFLMSIILIGAESMQRTIQIPVEMIYLMQTILVLIIVSVRNKLNMELKNG